MNVRHGTKNDYNRGCRCAECRQANTEYCKQQRYKNGVTPKDEYDRERAARVPHGTQHKYKKHGCRCDECRAWSRQNRAAIRAKRRGQAPAHVHGTVNGYQNYGCRCEPCTAVNSESTRLWKQQKRSAS